MARAMKGLALLVGTSPRRVIAESTGLSWAPRVVRNLATRELDAGLGALLASIFATGWEQSSSLVLGRSADGCGGDRASR